ncbi:MAG: Hsp70 family protein, partial [Candidatus Hydrogenedentes bacterium]|nr:Hsp70 family protein [Candidatus Hydrogenedentota bacterium]
VRNNADTLAYSTEKLLKEQGDKISAEDKTRTEEAIAKLRKALQGGDISAIEQASEELTQASHKIAEVMYRQAAEQQAASADTASEQKEEAAASGSQSGEEVVDADFEVVDEDEKKEKS